MAALRRLWDLRNFWDLDIKTRLSVSFLIGLVMTSILVPLLYSGDPNGFNPIEMNELAGPSLAHFFGTDELGRDVLLRSIYGARISLLVGFVAVVVSVSIGWIVGLVSGYVGGVLDGVMMRIVDVFMAIPTLFVILIIQVMLDPNIVNVMVVIGLTSWMGVARLVRADVLSVRQRGFVQAARARGIPANRLLFRHILPHTMTPVIVAAMLGMGGAILTESVLSFLGLGVQPPHASWGNMLQDSLAHLRYAPRLAVIPGVLIGLTVLSLNFIGDTLQSKIRGK